MSVPLRRRARTVRILAPACIFGCLAFGTSFGTEPERKIPVAGDRRGSELAVEITRDGSRTTAAPTATIAGPTMGRIREQIERRTGIDPGQVDSGPDATAPAAAPNREITARDARGLIKALRDAARARRPAAPPAAATGTGNGRDRAAPAAGAAPAGTE